MEPIIDDNANVTIEPPPADDEVESPPEAIVEAVEEVPVKKPRGRPKGKAAPKAPPKAKAVPKAPKLQRAVTTRRKPEPEYSDSSRRHVNPSPSIFDNPKKRSRVKA